MCLTSLFYMILRKHFEDCTKIFTKLYVNIIIFYRGTMLKVICQILLLLGGSYFSMPAKNTIIGVRCSNIKSSNRSKNNNHKSSSNTNNNKCNNRRNHSINIKSYYINNRSNYINNRSNYTVAATELTIPLQQQQQKQKLQHQIDCAVITILNFPLIKKRASSFITY